MACRSGSSVLGRADISKLYAYVATSKNKALAKKKREKEIWVFQPAASWPNDGGDKIGSINLLVLTVAQISRSFLHNRLNNLLVPCLSIFHVFFSPVNMNVVG